ncbi:archaellin/type IV pilin N-terminal domain-containing protein [Halobacterium zhouii]|uniref:archaellin/type IV pilin N-terminal domain-containing protein n=1 Tax=Halobacterium zhouii TaxID=2902624 RepID=UPI001E5FA317|nr:archaellin/type IV pilin N-terminal domain-containing protein [Halobacterium zhouii]
MFEFITDEEERGQVGIGTLIVFIAMVLVAAIAAGVLINTAGFLQTKSEATGQEASAQVSNRVTVVNAYGSVNDANDSVKNGTVHFVNVTVMRAAGSENINLSEATIQWIGPNQATTLVNGPNNADQTSNEQFATIGVTDDDQDQVLSDKDTRIKLVMNATAIKNDDGSFSGTGNSLTGLMEGENVKLTITTQYGASTDYWVSVPESLMDKQAVKL